MDIQTPIVCSGCHINVRASDYFCFNCGRNLHPVPPSTSIGRQIYIYLGSIFLPPIGILWGFRYLRQDDLKSKIVGITAIALTFLIIYLAYIYTVQFFEELKSQLNTQMQTVPGLNL